MHKTRVLNRKNERNKERFQDKIFGEKFYLGIIFAILSWVLCDIGNGSLGAKSIFACIFLVAGTLRIEVPEKINKYITLIWFVGSVFVLLFSSQLLLNESLFSLGIVKIILGGICCSIVLWVILLVVMNYRCAVIATTLFILIFTTVNYFVFKFRGSEFAPADLQSINTAMSVVDGYRFSIDAPYAYACVTAWIYCFISFCLPKCNVKRDKKNIIKHLSVAVILVSALIVGSKDLKAYHFLQSGSVTNGYLLNFVLQVKESIVFVPENYDVSEVDAIEKEYEDSRTDSITNKPDIIVIMNESFVDLSVLGNELQTNIEVIPYFKSLSENTVKGYALSSVMGGGTVNSEYEFLSGNTMGYLPTGSIVYQQFLEDESYTLISYLNSLGYSTNVTHPCPAINWTRNQVYPIFGFDNMYFEEYYPKEKIVRDYVSDQEVYEQIISWYEGRNKAQPFFLYGITMQNHGSYYYEGDNFTNEINLEGYSQEYSDVEQYLTLIHKSDEALEYLIEYFESVEKDVIVLFYGDHFPKLDDSFLEEVHGGTFDTLEQQMLQYTVPFVIWANFDIEEYTVETTSLNFLSNYLFDVADMERPIYNAFLEDVNAVIPAMNAYGYYSKTNGQFITLDEAVGEEKEILEKYNILQYNCMFDKENLSEVFFALY